MGRSRCALLGLLLLLAADAWAQKTLSWDNLDVQARLDADGRLHVTERQVIVFNGDWNGGERSFRLAEGQELQLQRLARVDDRGTSWPLTRGNLGAVHNYDWTDATTLRWRSRLPSDPPFRDTRLTYVLEYTYSNILQPTTGGDYLLDHEFAFADRKGVVRRFSLDLVLDPVWQSRGPVPTDVVVSNLAPGRTYTVRLGLAFSGRGRPVGVDLDFWRPWMEWGAFWGLAVVPLLALGYALWREWNAGRFDPLPAVSRAWIETNVLPHRAEVIGAAWDEVVGAPEVAAVIARLQGEGKLESEVGAAPRFGSPEITLRLKVPLGEFEGYEGDLLQSLFFGGGDVTSTASLRSHYSSTGFNPAGKIQVDVEKASEALVGGDLTRKPSWLPGTLLFWGGVGLIVTELQRSDRWHPGWVGVAVGFLLAWLLGHAAASAWRRRVDRGLLWAVPVLLFVAIPLGGAYVYLRFGPAGWRGFLHAGTASVGLSVCLSVINAARSRRGPQSIRLRKWLCGARRFFIDELKKPAPALEDSWFPYAVAFGLDSQVRHWFGQFGALSNSVTHSSSSWSGSSSTSSGGSSGWTGGGGSFGGAGATASWAAAVGGLAAGVASPSSSGSGGGGGGGGSSSGGGGGGGW